MDVYEKIMGQEGNQWMQKFRDMAAIPVPIHQLESPPVTDEAKAVMSQHQCEVVEHLNYCTVMFPEGTMRTEIYPRTHSERYRIMLPDRFEMMEIYDRFQEQSMLFLVFCTDDI
jgi:hypothetical protein